MTKLLSRRTIVAAWCSCVLAAVLLVLTNYVKQTKKLHPIVFIGLSAVVGILFHFGGM